ncbi:hypothetical protein DENSPDRAFT_162875 [Dentipellis sp. KUC8613]|nr:hypothetical protein DENSPDRAFT_162875 [Dentipellis sp. KUC8613]
MQPHQYLGTYAFPDVDFYHRQSSSRSPSRAQHTDPYQQTPSRVHNTSPGVTWSTPYAPAPTPNNFVSYSPGHAPARSVTPEPWEAATSEFQVSAYRHEVPEAHYESQFSVNSVHDSLRDTGPWIYNPDDDCDTRGSSKRQASRLSQAAVALHETRLKGAEDPIRVGNNTAQTPTRGKMKPRTAEQKERMAKSAAGRRANDKDHLNIIKEKLPPLQYGQQYNNRTALAGAIQRFDRDEETIRALREERSNLTSQLKYVERQLKTEAERSECVASQRDWLQAQLESTQATLETVEAALSQRDAENVQYKLEIQRKDTQLEIKDATLLRAEGELRYYKECYGAR